MLDWAFLLYFVPDPARCTIHSEYYDRPVLRAALRAAGAIPLRTDRPDHRAIRLARRALFAGEPLLMFPEGGISRTGRPTSGYRGVIALAMAAQVPILPAAIQGAFEVFPRHRRLPRPGAVRVTFGPLLPPPARADRITQRELTGELVKYLGELLDGVTHPYPPW